MNRRPGVGQQSTADLHISFTLEAEARIKGLAFYLRQPYGALLRELAAKKRQALYDEGLRPPLKPKTDPISTGPRNDGETRVYRHIRCTPDEKSAIVALAEYIGVPYSQLLVDLAEAERKRLWDEESKRPPVRPPATGDAQDAGPATPRRRR